MKLHKVFFVFLSLSKTQHASASNDVTETECSLDGTCSFSDEKFNASKSNAACKDVHDQCPEWANSGDCVLNPRFMMNACQKSCSVCFEQAPVDTQPCVDESHRCEFWERKNQCVKNPYFMLARCRKVCRACPTSITHTIDFGVRQQQDESRPEVTAVVRQSMMYMRKIMGEPSHAASRELCRNGNELCSIWAAEGECKNPAIQTLCGPACQSCHMVDLNKKCEMDSDVEDALSERGDLTEMFENMTRNDIFQRLEPTIVYRPYKRGQRANPGPWFLEFERFLSDEEIEKILKHGERRGYGKSEEVTVKGKVDGSYDFLTSTYKTPFQSWCDRRCEQDPVIQRVIERASNLLGLPQENAEPLKLFRYTNGENSGVHHDYDDMQKYRPCGVRIVTFSFYLNDDFVGGETNFNFMHNMTIVPKKGKAVVWTNVKKDTPNEEDELLDHKELPVTEGVKYAVNLWFHQRDFKNSFRKTCT